jgi:nucleoporin POM152
MLKKARKTALQNVKHHSPSQPLTLKFPVKKTGLYTIRQIIDESKLEVRPKRSEAVVVQCPQARVLPTNANKCRGDLSDIGFEVIGTPPLRVKYRKVVGSNVIESSFQSIQPDDFTSPLVRHQQALATKDELSDASWARPRRIVVPVNETLAASGSYWYAVDQVQDAMGNSVSYEAQLEDYERGSKGKVPESQQIFTVHDRPIVSLRGQGDRLGGCDTQHPLKVAKGEKEVLPVRFSSYGAQPIVDTVHTVEYEFTPSNALDSDSEQIAEVSQRKIHTFKNSDDRFPIGDSGLYTLVGVSTPFCAGEVREPASCMLQNPPVPEVDFQKSDIKDKCHENAIGMRLALNLIGSPPFKVDYTIARKKGHTEHRQYEVKGLRGQLDLQPVDAGDYTYKFLSISDKYYKAVKLDLEPLQQSVKPAASARFDTRAPKEPLCLNEQASFHVKLGGDGPWNLKYEIIYPGGRRRKFTQENIESDDFTIETEPLDVGGEYAVSITSVQAGGCAEDLSEQVTFSVRYQKPRAGFGPVDGKRHVNTLENKRLGLPVRLTGERPWSVQIKDGSGTVSRQMLTSENSKIEALAKGEYEILSVQDRFCPGEVDAEASTFGIEWIERPGVKIVEETSISMEGRNYAKEAVCEGYDDSFEIVFSGKSFEWSCTHLRKKLTDSRQRTLRARLRRTCQARFRS